MSDAIHISASLNPLTAYDILPELHKISRYLSISALNASPLVTRSLVLSNQVHLIGRRILKPFALSEGPLKDLVDSPVSVELETICSEIQFDRIIAEAQQLEESVIIVWTAKWCRKCIYLKPKLEKLAADYHPRLRFYCVDVNTVPHKLVVRAGVTKMPTIQLWKDSKKQAEVIGGHKAYLVVNEVREMIENELPM